MIRYFLIAWFICSLFTAVNRNNKSDSFIEKAKVFFQALTGPVGLLVLLWQIVTKKK